MNDFDYDVMQKRRIAGGDRHRKRGSKSRRCSLPSDNLTDAQRRKLNGPVRSYKLGEPMTYAAFKALPEDLQRDYLLYLHENYGATYKMVAEMFGCPAATIQDIRTSLNLPWAYRRRLPRDIVAARDRKWKAFLDSGKPAAETEGVNSEEGVPSLEEIVPITPDNTTEAEPDNTTEAKPEKGLALSAFSAEFTGSFNMSRLLEGLSAFPVYGMPQVRIRVEVEIAEGGEADEVPAHAAPANCH